LISNKIHITAFDQCKRPISGVQQLIEHLYLVTFRQEPFIGS